MGGGGSKTISDTGNISINESTIDKVSKAINRCTTSISQSQVVKLRARGDITVGETNMTQNATIDSKCLLTAERQTEIKRAFVNDIMNQIKTKNKKLISIVGNGSESRTRNIIENRLNTNISNKDIQESINTIANMQKIDYISLNGNITLPGINMSQGAKLYAKSVLQTSQFTKIVEDLNTIIENDIETVDDDPIADITSFMSDGLIKLIALGGGVMILVLIIFAVIVFLFKRGGSSSMGPGGVNLMFFNTDGKQMMKNGKLK